MASFLVTGATGRQGGSTARQLLEKGAKVHALVRDPESESAKAIQAKGAVLFKGDAANADAITAALQGVSGVFFNPPYPGPELLPTAKVFIETCVAHKDTVTTFVYSSASGTEQHAERVKRDPEYAMGKYWAMKAAIEDIVRDAGFRRTTILRPSFLMHMYLQPMSPIVFPGLEQGKLTTALKPDTKVPHLQAEDVGHFAAAALMNPEDFNGREINLAAENLTLAEMAKVISDVAGVEVEAPLAEFEDGKAVGIDSPLAAFHSWTNQTDASIDSAALRKDYGLQLTTLREFLQERKEEIQKAVGV